MSPEIEKLRRELERVTQRPVEVASHEEGLILRAEFQGLDPTGAPWILAVDQASVDEWFFSRRHSWPHLSLELDEAVHSMEPEEGPFGVGTFGIRAVGK